MFDMRKKCLRIKYMSLCYRIVSKPPYEVSETGWGEFEVQIKIHLADPQERPVTLYHVLKLFHTPGTTSTGSGATAGEAVSGDGSTTTSAVVQGRKTVVSECYDEIVFQVSTRRRMKGIDSDFNNHLPKTPLDLS